MATILVLKQVGSYIVKAGPWAWKQLPGNKPVGKAITLTHHRYSSRLPGLKAALELWIVSDDFLGQVTSIQDGTLTDSDIAHVERFVTVSGLGLGTGSLQTVGEALEFFYAELYRELCSSDEGLRVVGAQVGAVHQEVSAVRQVIEDLSRVVEAGLKTAPYRPPVEIDSTSKATTEADRQAETELNIIKQLVDRRQAKTALTLLANIQPRVDNGTISSPIRLRFYLNKGVCHMLLGNMDDANREFERARTLDPANVKVLINLAQVSVLEEKYEAALPYVDSILGAHIEDPNANALRFMCLHELGRDSEIAKVLSDHPALADDAHCLYTLAYIASDDERFDEAEYYLRRHNELADKYPEAWELLGRVIVIPMQREILRTVASPNWISSTLRERIEEAEVCFSKSEQLLVGAEVQESLKFTLANRGVARTLLGHDDDARKDFERALAMYPEMEEFKRNLGNIYLASGKPQQAVALFEAIQSPSLKEEVLPFLAACYLEMNKPETVRDLLGPVADVVTGGIRLFVQDLYLAACQRLKDSANCERVLAALDQACPNPEARRIAAEYYARDRNFDDAIRLMQLSVEEAGEGLGPRYRVLLGDVFFRAERYAEAAEQYELVPVPVGEFPECMRHLVSLARSEQYSKALRLAQSVRGDQRAVAPFSDVEAVIHERSGALEVANDLRRGLIEAGMSPERQKLCIAINEFRRQRPDEAASLTMEVELNQIDKDAELLKDAAFLRTVLALPDALVFAYHLLQIEPESPDVHLFYVNTFFRRESFDHDLLNPGLATIDCAVTLKHNGERQVLTIVDGSSDIAKNWFSVNHELAKQLLGKGAGETIRFREGELSETEYEVVAVQSKFVRAFQDSIGHFSARFPTHPGISSMDVKENDPTKLVLMLERRRALADQILGLYGGGKLPSCTAARLLGKSDAEFFKALVNDPQTKVLSFSGNQADNQHELAGLAAASSILLETSSLVTLHSLNVLGRLVGVYSSILVTQQTLDALIETASEIYPAKQSGHMVSDSPGHMRLVENTTEAIVREKTFYDEILQFVNTKCCIVAPSAPSALTEFENLTIKEMLGSVALSAVATAKGSGCLMISDDLQLIRLAQEAHGVAGAGSLSLLRDLRRRAILSSDEYHKAVQWLVEQQMSFVSIGKDDLIWALRQSDWSPTPAVARSFHVLAGPDCDANAALAIGIEMLHEIWSEPNVSTTKQLLSDLLLQSLVAGRVSYKVIQVLQSLNVKRSRLWTPAMAEIQRVLQSWRARR